MSIRVKKEESSLEKKLDELHDQFYTWTTANAGERPHFNVEDFNGVRAERSHYSDYTVGVDPNSEDPDFEPDVYIQHDSNPEQMRYFEKIFGEIAKNNFRVSSSQEYFSMDKYLSHKGVLFLDWFRALCNKEWDTLSVLTFLMFNKQVLSRHTFDLLELMSVLKLNGYEFSSDKYTKGKHQYIKGYDAEVRNLISSHYGPNLSPGNAPIRHFLDLFSSKVITIKDLLIKSFPDFEPLDYLKIGIDYTALHSISKTFLLDLIHRGAYLSVYHGDLFFSGSSTGYKRNFMFYYHTAKKLGINIDNNIIYMLQSSDLQYEYVGIRPSLCYVPFINKLILVDTHYDNPSEITDDGILKVPDLQGYSFGRYIFNNMLQKAEEIKEDYIVINGKRIERNLFEQSIECNIDELIMNLEFEESQ